MDYLPAMVSNVQEFHKKFGIGINVRSQEEMYARCSLLLEELGELGELIDCPNNSNYLQEEIADVTYVLLGNLVSLGFETFCLTHTDTDINPKFEYLVLTCSQIAKKVRKEWKPNDIFFRNNVLSLHFKALQILYVLAENHGFEFYNIFYSKHKKLLNRKSKVVGNTIVVSHWNEQENIF